MAHKDPGTYDIEKIRGYFKSFYKEISLVWYGNITCGKKLDIDKVNKKYRFLADRKLILFLKNMIEETKNKDAKERYKRLYFALIDFYISQKTAEMTKKLNRLSMSLIKVGDKKIPLRNISTLMAKESDRNERKKLFLACNGITKKWNVMFLKSKRDVEKLAKSFGFNSLMAMQEKYPVDYYYEFSCVLTRLIKETDDMYKELRKHYARVLLNLKLNEIRFYDTPALNKFDRFDKFFPKEKLIANTRKTFMPLGFDIDKQKNLSFDYEERPEKIPGASAYAISIPDDIRLIAKPVNGLDAYEMLFHELGHGEHFANTDKKLAFEFQYFGNNSITETFAFLFENILFNKLWLKKYLDMSKEERREYLKYNLFLKLSSIRNVCLLFKFDLALYSGKKRLVDYFARLCKNIFYVKVEKNEKLRYMSSNSFYSMNHLHGWFLEAQLRALLKRKYGDYWFENKECGDFLKRIWSTGLRFTVDEFVRYLGFKRVEPKYLINELKTTFKECR